jgi:hypothetical protein
MSGQTILHRLGEGCTDLVLDLLKMSDCQEILD